MKLLQYTPTNFDRLRTAALRVSNHFGLVHRPFVNYYYASRDWCKLYLVLGKDEEVLGTIGVDQMRFEYRGREMFLGFASNFYAFQPGVGGYLYLQWIKTSPVALEFGGSEDAHRLLRHQKWTYFPGVKIYLLNYAYPCSPEDSWLRRSAKSIIRLVERKRISKYASGIPPEVGVGVSVHEEPAYAEDLLPRQSPFTFRFAPTLEYLSWRYSTRLSFARYRLFRVLDQGRTLGYVIIKDSPEELIVAQCDGENAATLAYGVLLSILDVARDDLRPRTVLLSCCHAEMKRIYERFGFKVEQNERPFALGVFRRQIDLPSDTSNWLVNYDWGDNGLRWPFMDQSPDQGRQRGTLLEGQ